MNDPTEMERAAEYFRQAHKAQMAGELTQAVDLYRRSISEHPTAEAHTFLGWTYSFMGRYAEAISECRKAIDVDPEFGNPYNDIGAYLIELGRLEDAIPWLKRAMKARRYEPRHFPHFNLARIYTYRSQYELAIKYLRRAISLQPDYVIARRELRRIQALLN